MLNSSRGQLFQGCVIERLGPISAGTLQSTPAGPLQPRGLAGLRLGSGVLPKNQANARPKSVYHDLYVARLAADRTGRRSTHPVLYLLLIIAIGACALWGVMDLLARVTGIDWPI